MGSGQGAVPSLGAGYDTFDGIIKNSILNVKQRNDRGPSEVSSEFSICTTTEQIMQKLNINASIEASFKVGSISARVDYARSLCKSSTSVVTLLSIKKVSQNSTAEKVEFSDTITNAAEMYKRGGDSYVSYVKEGCQYLAAY
jgi:hypothetical protein